MARIAYDQLEMKQAENGQAVIVTGFLVGRQRSYLTRTTDHLRVNALFAFNVAVLGGADPAEAFGRIQWPAPDPTLATSADYPGKG